MGVVYRSSLLLPFVDRNAVAAPPLISCLFLYIVLLLCIGGLAGEEMKEFPIVSSSEFPIVSSSPLGTAPSKPVIVRLSGCLAEVDL